MEMDDKYFYNRNISFESWCFFVSTSYFWIDTIRAVGVFSFWSSNSWPATRIQSFALDNDNVRFLLANFVFIL